jgi:predicted dehydrogenase
MKVENNLTRREFVSAASKAVAGIAVLKSVPVYGSRNNRDNLRRTAMVGTGHRGSDMWGKSVVKEYSDYVDFVGLCDNNPGRLEFVKKYMGVSCPAFTNYEKMISETKPDTVIVTTPDYTHDYFIIKTLELGCNVITEKPLTTDENKLNKILEAQRKYNKEITVTFNYRYSPHRARMKELLMEQRVGKITSVDFHWYLDVYHGADYFRRWHRKREYSGSLLVHKASHHFDLLNWWVDSEPDYVTALGGLEFYGKNNPYRHTHCRSCPFKDKCRFYWDINQDKRLVNLYVNNEHHDGYYRDGCVWKEDINIFDKMAVQIKYKNNVNVSYSLTTYSPYEGYRIAFNGTKGRIEMWIHERQPWPKEQYDEIMIVDNFGKMESIKIPLIEENHAGGDNLMKDRIFKNTFIPDPLNQKAGLKDGALSILIGIAARKSIDTGNPIKISDLCDIH